MTTVRALMTPAPHTIGAEQSVEEAVRRMRQLRVRHLPVLAGGHLVGMLSERDARLVDRLAQRADVKVSEVMSVEAFAVSPDDDLRTVVEAMATRKLGSAVVLEDRQVVGIFTTTDAMHLLLSHLTLDEIKGF